MPAPKGNTNAAKPDKDKAAKSITFRCSKDLKSRVEKAAKKRQMKPSPWLVEAAEEKLERDKPTPKNPTRHTKGKGTTQITSHETRIPPIPHAASSLRF